MKRLFFISFQFFAIAAIAQVKDTTAAIAPPPIADTNIHIYAPAIVQNTEQKIYQYQRYIHGTSPGYRVQIDFSQQKDAVGKIQSDFSSKYPGVPTYLTYNQPYFKLNVGDFRTKLQAVDFLNHVRKDYPAAFVVADRIMPPPL